ncbi:rhodanese-like domain-containing protein [Endozoicomonas sp. 4G]|uniref:rhodanese-like domain-containing protein n=1 Tax=Endozoicomonas sp. 4G TaxID=2872754 RepID=UPI002078A481|nr:rhodanese-like domain-containing protein [Endozoicomonas sp. 4G]
MLSTWFRNPRRLACAVILFSTSVVASENTTEDRLAAYNQHYPAISYTQLRKAIDAGEVFLLDTNRAETYAKGHLPGAYSLADRATLERRLPVLKNYPIVVYCGGPQCTAWFTGADFATAKGYTNIMHFKGGLKEWKEQGDSLATGKTQ